MFVAVLINTISTLLTPVAAYVDIYFLIVLRILEGLGGVSTVFTVIFKLNTYSIKKNIYVQNMLNH